MDHVIARIAKVSITTAALLAGSTTSATSDDGANRPAMRRLPPVEEHPPTPAWNGLGDFGDGWSSHSEPTPAMRRLPDISVETAPPVIEVAATEPAVLDFKRLPEVDEEVADGSETVWRLANRWAESGGALRSVREQARSSTAKGYDLAEKGALYSARAEFIESLRGVSLGLDAHYGGSVHTDHFLAGLRALKEADDFVASGARLETHVDVAAIAASHQTELPADFDAATASPVRAMQEYYEIAQQSLVAATGGAKFAAESLYGLGKVYMSFAEQSQAAPHMHTPKAMAYFTSALTVDPSHALAANELGVMYARLGRLIDARRVLQQSVAAGGLAESWQNLAAVHGRLGEAELAARATSQANRLAAAASTRMPAAGVRWVSPDAFANRPETAAAVGDRAAWKQSQLR